MSKTRLLRSWERYFQRTPWQQKAIASEVWFVFFFSMMGLTVLLIWGGRTLWELR